MWPVYMVLSAQLALLSRQCTAWRHWRQRKQPVKCDTRASHGRKRVSLEELNFLREESRKSGQRAGLICPACVKRAFDNPEEYDIDIPLGELVVEAAKETPRWRICFTPDGLR